MTGKDTTKRNTAAEPRAGADTSKGSGRSFARAALARLAGHRRIAGGLAGIAIAAVLALAYVAGGPPGTGASSSQSPSLLRVAASAAPAAPGVNAQVPVAEGPVDTTSQSFVGKPGTAGGSSTTVDTIASAQIVTTGQLSLEVTNIDAAVGRSKTAIAGLGGKVSQSNQWGSGQAETATITFRLPAARWEDALSALRGISSKVLSESTDSTDVGAQVVDLQARLDNLRATETALQAIMARATAVSDVLAVYNQLSQTRGEIEALQAQLNYLKDQVAMSTLTVTFQLPQETVTTQATQDWTLGDQVDQAVAGLVRIGQGLATILVWLVIVVLPIILVLLVLFVAYRLIRRIFGRGRRDAAVGA